MFAWDEEWHANYILDPDHNPVPFDTFAHPEVWAKWHGDIRNRRVKQNTIAEYWISTVFTGYNLGMQGEPPLLFETQVQRDDDIIETWKCSTWDEALKQHSQMEKIITVWTSVKP